jgi:heme oxygenase
MNHLSNPPTTLRSLLRAHVWPLHQQLDRSPTLQALTRPDLDAHTYTRVLADFHLAYQHIEPDLLRLEQSIQKRDLPAYRPRLFCIQKEYALFNGSGPHRRKPATPLPPMPKFQCLLSAYLGSRYVLEGASQGTPHVIHALQNHHPAWPLHPEGYWLTLLTQGSAWRRLCQLLDTPQNEKAVTLSEIKKGATWIFESFIASLTPAAGAHQSDSGAAQCGA